MFSSQTIPHILPHIKIRVTEGVSTSGLDLVRGGGAAGRRGLCLGSAVYLIGWRRGLFSKCLIYFLSGLTTQESLLIFKFLQTQQNSDYIIPHAY